MGRIGPLLSWIDRPPTSLFTLLTFSFEIRSEAYDSTGISLDSIWPLMPAFNPGSAG
jgi:hypothetical protein